MSVSGREFVARPVLAAFQDVLDRVRQQDLGGRVADYIPELAKADPDGFAIAATTVSGRAYATGDSASRFTIQSISKPFVYALALAEHGVDTVAEHVGIEPSGEAFNAISFDDRNRPANPLINAGAIVTTSLIPAANGAERYERIRQGLSAFAGRQLDVDQTVYESESTTGDRNRALATLARSFGVLSCDVDEAAEPYFQQCSLLVDATDLSAMGATLANNGVNPITGARVVKPLVAQHVLSVMLSCGMYDRSGEWLFEVGMPAKSGVGGGIIAVAPGEYGIGVFSPPLDAAGNSARGVAALESLSQEFGLHVFSPSNQPTSPVQEVELSADGTTTTFRLRGAINFVAAEQIAFETARLFGTGQRALVFDFTGVTTVTDVASRLFADLVVVLRDAGWQVDRIDPDGGFPG